MKVIKQLIKFLAAPLFIIVVALFISKIMIGSKKARPPVPRAEVSTRVAVMNSAPETVNPKLDTFGNTEAYLTAALSSQVSGEIMRIAPNFKTGKAVSKGDWLVDINRADYEATLASREATLATAQQALADEETRSQLAADDWIASGRDIVDASDFTLRKPQLTAARANVKSAQAAVQQAKLDLERTTLRAPFDAIIASRNTSPGNVVMMGTILGNLFARERIQVRLPITPSQATNITLPHFDSASTSLTATLTTPTLSGVQWKATINRSEPSVDPKNQTVYLIGEVEKPFENPNAFLPIGAFVNAIIEGNALENVHTFPEVAVVDDAFVWVVQPDNTLAKQPIDILFSQDNTILTRIEEPVYNIPLTVVSRPLASFKVGQPVIPVSTEEKTKQ